MGTTVERLIEVLKELDQRRDLPVQGEDPEFIAAGEDEDVDLAVELVNEVLLADCEPREPVNTEARKILHEAGFEVAPGEADSFGWLSGILRLPTAKKTLVFG